MRYDAIVIGGGPSGATAGALLARQGRRVAIAEKAAFPRRKVCGEYISATTWPVLAELGVSRALAGRAGDVVTRVGFFAGDVVVDAPMPLPREMPAGGRAIGRDILDAALLDQAKNEGAEVFQPCAVESVRRKADVFEVAARDPARGVFALRAPLVIDAHGSWEPGPLLPRAPRCDDDLFGFKARFSGAALAGGLMPLVLFPGAYGGLVHTDGGEVSFSCCIRRDALAACRQRHGGSAGDAVLGHALETNRGIRETLGNAQRAGPWLSAGPIRPGVRALAGEGIFRVGNAAGEAHPLVAEGISMAIQSGYLLARVLGGRDAAPASLDAAAREYAREWRSAFSARVHASQLFAALMVPPLASRASVALLERAPEILTWGARWSGKARALRGLAA